MMKIVRICFFSMFGMNAVVFSVETPDQLSPDKLRSAIMQVIGKSHAEKVPAKSAPTEKSALKSPLKREAAVCKDKIQSAIMDAMTDFTSKSEPASCSFYQADDDLKCTDDIDIDDQGGDDGSSVDLEEGGSDNVVIGTYVSPKNLTVTGNERVGGALMVGTISSQASLPGCRYIIGAVPFDPQTQQFEIRFKDKSRLPSDPLGNGAYIELDFISTGSKVIGGGSGGLENPDCSIASITTPSVNLGCRFSGFFGFPKMAAADLAVNANGTAIGRNNIAIQCDSSLPDLRLTFTARIKKLTKDLAIGVVPVVHVGDNPLEAGGYLFYGKGGYTESAYQVKPGMLAYKIVSDNVFSVGLTGIGEEVAQDDILSSLSDCELLALYKILQSWFGVDVLDHCKAIELIQKNKSRLGGLLRGLNIK